MPEGDTIHRAARRLQLALVGERVLRFEAPRVVGPRPAPGVIVAAVEATGKYLLIHFDDGLVLETHMRMTGSWHLYRPGERWRRRRRGLRALVGTGDWDAVCFSAPHVVVRSGTGRGAGRPGHLGPDLCRDDADLDEVVRRLAHRDPADDPVAVALLDQRVFCGVGNVYKSEVLHACRIHPETPTGGLVDAQRRSLAETAHRLLRANLVGGPRITVPGVPGGLAVYRRADQPCHRCGAPIRRAVHGEHARSSYWCPTCQPRPEGAPQDGPEPGTTTPDS